jgi:hypothetical protein
MALLGTGSVIAVFVPALTGGERILDDGEQDINQRILDAVKLMSNEADQM